MRDRHQGGWIANFLIVGVLLVVGLIGAIYFLKSQGTDGGDQIATEETQQSTESDTETQSSEEKKDSQSDAAKEDKEAKDEKNNSSKTDKSSTSESTSKDDSDKQVKEQTDLPATGPAEAMQAVVGLSALTFSASAYIQSRRARRL
ncbi:MAG TPA: hypothetical protein VGE34_00035 [Candidatus Saccharimonadales bacterium]